MQQLNNIGKDIPLGGKWAQVRVGPGRSGVGRKEILREVIGPGPGRVPGLFRQKGGSIIQIRKFDFYQGQMTNTIELFLCEQFFVC